jgi:N4-gp56 family major capsid protein
MAFTSIKTTGGWSTDAVQAAYALQFNWDLHDSVLFYGLIDHEPQQVPHPGSSITEQLNAFYTDADVAAAVTPLDEETDVTPVKLPPTSSVTYTPAERGFANQRTIKLAKRGLTPVDPVISMAVAQHAADTLDRFTQLQARTGTNVLRAGARASTATVTASDTAVAADVREIVSRMTAANAQKRAGNDYLGVAHPFLIHDWRAESGPGAWRTPVEYGASQDKIWKGEFGEFEGVRWISSNSTHFSDIDNDGATGINVYRAHVLGREALGKAVVTAPTTVVGPVTDTLKRFRSLGWYSDLDVQVYRQAALYRYEAASSLG